MRLLPLDAAVVVLFLAGVLALGFSARLRDSSLIQYLVAGRSLSLPLFVATLVSTWYGGVLAIGDAVKAYGVGTILLYGVPYYVFALVYAFWLARRVRGAEQISIPERLESRWGRSAGLVGALLVFLLAVPAAHVRMLGVLAQLATGWTLPVAIVVGAVGGTLFLYRGGLLADVRAGLLAFLAMYAGFLGIVAWCLVRYPLGATMSRLDPTLLRPTGGVGPVPYLSFFALGAWTLVDPGFHQRVASAATPDLGRKGVLVSVGFWLLFDLLSVTAGLYALALLRPAPSGLAFFPLLGDQVLPPGLKGLFLCGLVGAVLSGMVGYTLVSGATFGREILGRLLPDSGERRLKGFTRVGFGLACLIAVGLAIRVENVAIDLWYLYSGAVVGALILPVAAAYAPRPWLRAGPGWVSAAMIGAAAVSFGWMIYAKQTNNPSLVVYLGGSEFMLGTLIPGLAVSAAVLGLGHLAQARRRHDG